MLGQSLEDYLEAIWILNQRRGPVRSVEVARYLNFSRPSVCHAVKRLQENGYLTKADNGLLYLSKSGEQLAGRLYERRSFFVHKLVQSGVSPETARQDACRIEHMLSDESFEAIKRAWAGK